MLQQSQVSKTVCPAGLAIVVESGIWGVSISIFRMIDLWGAVGDLVGTPEIQE
jgi:hypothetical protein